MYSDEFQGYAKPVDISHSDTTGPDAQLQQMAVAHLVALEFQRATSLLTISYALPKDDPRVPVFRRLAAVNANWGYANISVGGYEGQHLLGTYAMLYENAAKGPAPTAAPEKPKGREGDRGEDQAENTQQ